MSLLGGAKNTNISNGTFIAVQGTFNQVQKVEKDPDLLLDQFYTRLCTNFPEEPSYISYRHRRNLEKRIDGTCDWIFDNREIEEWQENTSGSPILWIHGSPGSGKSIACSLAIESFLTLSHVVGYHFCDFSRQYKPIEVLSMLAYQLLSVGDPSQILPPSLLAATSAHLKREETMQHLIKICVEAYPKVYLFLDGLDEELPAAQSRWREGMEPVLKFLTKLASEYPSKLRLLCSSQYRDEFKERLPNCRQIDITEFAKRDISTYLTREVPRISGPESSFQTEILNDLKNRSESSFIWASFMVGELRQQGSLSEMKDFLEGGFPRNLDEYYVRIFHRFAQHHRSLACKVFALIIFARRPLRFSELWEAVWALQSRSKDDLCIDDKPFRERMESVFQPCIELVKVTDGRGDGHSEERCRLVHSTLRDFLLKRPDVLCQESHPSVDLKICIEAPMNACLFYLSQSRYSDLLNRQDDKWVDATGKAVDNQGHFFLLYAAKYWDKHLDDVTDPKRREEFREKITSFLKSNNFWTCMQVQSLWVESQFNLFKVTGLDDDFQYLRRLLPAWFLGETEVGHQMWKDYRHFLREWRYLLNCGNCGYSSHCKIIPYIGQIDRAWTGALSPGNFLSQRKSQYKAFSFQTKEDTQTFGYSVDCVTEIGQEFVILKVSVKRPVKGFPQKLVKGNQNSVKAFELKCRCETWRLSGSAPELQHKQVITVEAGGCNWDLFMNHTVFSTSEVDRAPAAAFSHDGRTLRIGTNLYQRTHKKDFEPLGVWDADPDDRRTAYFEEFARRGGIIVLTSRTKLNKKDVIVNWEDFEDDEDEDKNPKSDEENFGDQEDDDDDDSSSEAEAAEDSTESESESEHSSIGIESGSDDSDKASVDSKSEDEIVPPWAEHVYASDKSSDESEDDAKSNSDASSWGQDEEAEVSSGSEDDEVDPKIFDRSQYRDDKENDWEDVPQYLNGTNKKQKCQASIKILDLNSNSPLPLFDKKFPIRCKIYDSPPIIHPTKSLIVWPMGDGEVIFIDFGYGNFELGGDSTRYIIQRLSPSTPYTRHVSMKCRFSTCGKFLHIASLEAQKIDPNITKKMGGDPKSLPPVKLSVLVSTYRLSLKKNTVTPPMVHRVKVALGETNKISITKPPFSISWTPDNLYITFSEKILRVYRVPLFSGTVNEKTIQDCAEAPIKKDENELILTPRNPFFLPETAGNRHVLYFPPLEQEGSGNALPARILMGNDINQAMDMEASETDLSSEASWTKQAFSVMRKRLLRKMGGKVRVLMGEICPPLGCYIEEDNHLGGWVDSHARAKIQENLGVAVLHDRLEGMEKFNPDDDCILEPYLS